MIATEPHRIKRSVVEPAISNVNWPALKKHLSDVGLDLAKLQDLLEHIRHAASLIVPLPRQAQERRRDTFLDEIENFIGIHCGEQRYERYLSQASSIL